MITPQRQALQEAITAGLRSGVAETFSMTAIQREFDRLPPFEDVACDEDHSGGEIQRKLR